MTFEFRSGRPNAELAKRLKQRQIENQCDEYSKKAITLTPSNIQVNSSNRKEGNKKERYDVHGKIHSLI